MHPIAISLLWYNDGTVHISWLLVWFIVISRGHYVPVRRMGICSLHVCEMGDLEMGWVGRCSVSCCVLTADVHGSSAGGTRSDTAE